ncbi:MAG: aminotransferase class I/II-fold pyridoxal phosphate-dependent enzyme [Saccharofermentans sp.]|nr:aminotransferase class I/II-fold pyridoxal phosphate-dependent enzyme [Saccharofermentans sp.]
MKDTLNSRLKKLREDDLLPMHMPGHKRNPGSEPDGISYSCDITEIDGFDNLHSPEGVIRGIEKRAMDLWGADDALISVNGSSALLVASILSHTMKGDKILVASNCHISVWHGIELSGATPVLIDPDTAEDTPFLLGADPALIEEKLLSDPKIKAVVITSPTYEGIISNTGKIYEICKKKDVLLIVDEAHGAHFGIKGDNLFPPTSCGDIVIKSVHKTMSAPTQTAVLLMFGDRADRRLLRHFLSSLESTSPSYMLMAGLENALIDPRVDNLYKIAEDLRSDLKSLTKLRLYTSSSQDISKIVILTCGYMTGYELADLLREDFLIEVEASFPSYIIAMTGTGDTSSSLIRFAEAIKAIDSTVEEKAGKRSHAPSLPSVPRRYKMSVSKALRAGSSKVKAEDAAGQISAEYVFSYPPGVPLLIPGQEISEDILRFMEDLKAGGTNFKTDPYRQWDGTLLKVDTDA